MNAPSACIDCLRRSWLLAMLAPYLERLTSAEPASAGRRFLALSNEDLVQLAAPKVAEQLLARVAAIPEDRFHEELTLAESWATCRHGDRYPASLSDLDDAPWALFGRGEPDRLAELEPRRTVAIVGARRATSYGREVARQLGYDLAAADFAVISGLDFGIASCAHRGAIDGGHTIAVLGCGIDVPYPAVHRSLWRRITETGLVLSELPPGTTPWRWTFPARNRIIAALATMTVVVEAADRSGSLAIAERAVDLGSQLGAVPGPVTSRVSAGPNALLAGGARLVRGAEDVIEWLIDAEETGGTPESN